MRNAELRTKTTEPNPVTKSTLLHYCKTEHHLALAVAFASLWKDQKSEVPARKVEKLAHRLNPHLAVLGFGAGFPGPLARSSGAVCLEVGSVTSGMPRSLLHPCGIVKGAVDDA